MIPYRKELKFLICQSGASLGPANPSVKETKQEMSELNR